MICYWKKITNKLRSANSFCLWTLNCTSISKNLFLFQNRLSVFYWHHLAISTLVSVSLSWSLSWHHYDTYSCCSICFQKPVRGDWVGCWTVFCPYCGREARTVLHAIWPVFKISSGNLLSITEIVVSCALCVSLNFLSRFLTSELCTLQKVV